MLPGNCTFSFKTRHPRLPIIYKGNPRIKPNLIPFTHPSTTAPLKHNLPFLLICGSSFAHLLFFPFPTLPLFVIVCSFLRNVLQEKWRSMRVLARTTGQTRDVFSVPCNSTRHATLSSFVWGIRFACHSKTELSHVTNTATYHADLGHMTA